MNFVISALSPYNLQFSWNPPPVDAQNGVIIAYTLSCQPEEALTSLPVTYTSTGTYVLSGFSAATVYNCSVYAATAGGSGPSALQTIATLDDGNHITNLTSALFLSLSLSLSFSLSLSLSLSLSDTHIHIYTHTLILSK